MGRKIVRVGDKNSKGGKVLAGDNTVFLNGIPVALEGMPVSCHDNFKGPHVHARTRATESSVYINGKRLIFVGDIDTCGHPRVEGSPDVGVG